MNEQNEINVLRKEIQSLKLKTLWLTVGVISLLGMIFISNNSQLKQYSDIKNYYYKTQSQNGEILLNLEKLIFYYNQNSLSCEEIQKN